MALAIGNVFNVVVLVTYADSRLTFCCLHCRCHHNTVVADLLQTAYKVKF